MSAWICDTFHISLLAVFAVKHQACNHLGFSDYATIAKVLYDENVKSVDYRYSEENEKLDFAFDSRALTASVPPLTIIKLANCLEYQSCETDGWKESTARQLLIEIKDSACRAMPGYDDAPWGLSYEEYRTPRKKLA